MMEPRAFWEMADGRSEMGKFRISEFEMRNLRMDSPEKTLRLGILRLELGDPDLAAEATPNLGSGGGFEK